MGFEYTDSHVHFWDASLRPYPWLAGVPSIAAAHGPLDLALEAEGSPPSRVVFVQADCDRGRALDEGELGRVHGGPGPAGRGDRGLRPDGRRGRDLAGAQVPRGPAARARRAPLIQGETDPGFCLSPAFVEGVRECGELGLSFDLCVRHPQLSSVIELVQLCPATSFILDHAGKPDLRSNMLESWKAHIGRLAALPNVACKVSGLVTEAGTAALDPDRFVPTISHLLETFGPSRLLFGSDWPVVKLASPYATWLRMARALLAHLPEQSQASIFSGNAGRLYRLG